MLFIAVVAALAIAAPALAAISIRVTTTVVHVGGKLRGRSNGERFRVYLIEAKLAPCHNGCAARAKHPPGSPFVFVGRIPGRYGRYTFHRFAFRVPAVRPGQYSVFVYCPPCGSLIDSGEAIRVLR